MSAALQQSKLVVMKFGGTSVGTPERIRSVAKRVGRAIESGKQVVVVCSAMSGETDRLIRLGEDVCQGAMPSREYHQLLVTGEQQCIALVAAALDREGVKARSLVAPQLSLLTRRSSSLNLIKSIEGTILRNLLSKGIVPVIAGFQGVDEEGDYTTLGRGGSDATAVAVAVALGSCRCEIFTDVEGVYTALPQLCSNARKLRHLSYEEMLELAGDGAKVLQARSVSLAYKFRVPLFVLSSFSDAEGTEIVQEYAGMENTSVSGITCLADQAKLTLRELPDRPGIAARVFRVLGDANVIVDMIVQSQGQAGKATISCTIAQADAQRAYDALSAALSAEFPDIQIEADKNIAKLSVVGEGMRSHSGVAGRVFETLARESINVEMITTSEIKISVAIQQKYSELAVRVLHEEFIEKQF